MSQLSIRRLMQIAPALVVTGLVALYLSIHMEMSRTEQRINQQTVLSQAVGAMKDARYYIVQIQQFMTDVGATRQDEAMAEADASLQGALASLQQLADLLPSQAAQVQSLKQQVTRLHGAGAAMARAYLTQGLEAGNGLMKGSGGFDDTAAQLSAALDRLAQELEQRQQAAVAAALDSSAHATLMLVIGCGLLALFILAVMSFLYHRVIPSLLALADSMRDVASGSHDLTLQLEAKGQDEVAQVAASFNGFVLYMRDFMRSAGADSAALDRAGGELNASAKRTFAGMGQLQGEVEQVSSAMTEVQASVEEVARSAHAAAESALQAQVEADSGERVVGATIASINKLAQEVERACVVLQTLEGHSDNIGKIMVVIRGVAEQTNLLALNAAIEAARAGDQGRGFAVVADEVRSLALRTQESTEEIDKMVVLLQNGTRDAVGVMNDGQEVAAAAVSDASAAGEALQRITTAIGSITAMTSQIDAAAAQQSQATDEINRNISNINAESQRTLEDANQSSRASEQVRHLVAELGKAVRVFKVE